MGWRPGDDEAGGAEHVPAEPGGPEDRGTPRDERLRWFARGGQRDDFRPGPELAAVLADVAGPEWRCPGADHDELVGVLRRVAALESWASSAKLAVIREMIRQDDLPLRGKSRHGDLPDQWSDSLNHELCLALSSSARSAEQTAAVAWELGARLPGIDRLLADGTLTYAKARLIAETWRLLSDADAGLAEALLIPHLTGATGKTYAQIMYLAGQIAALVDPGLAERRRKAAVKHDSRVHLFREESGAAALCGRDLPTDEALAALANVAARAAEYKASGAFPGARMDQLRATAYLDLINGIAADARIALGYLSTDPCSSGEEPRTESVPEHPAADDEGEARDPGDDDSGDGGPEDGGPGGGGPVSGGPVSGGPGKGGPGKGGPGSGSFPGGSGTSPGGGGQPSGGNRPGPGQGPLVRPPRPVGSPVLTDLVLPLATLLGLAERPGESHGLGVLDPDLCRDLAALAAASPSTRACLTVTDPDGTAIGHGCGKSVGSPPGVPPAGTAPPVALPAQLNLTITAERLLALLSGAPVAPAGCGQPSRTGWALTRAASNIPSGAIPSGTRSSPADPDWCGTWLLTLPGGRVLAVRIVPVPVNDCDHRYESHAYQPSYLLRHLVQVRDRTCTFPTCNRHAKDSDFEHAVPYDQGGKTCTCNAGARSRRCHRVKQSVGWTVAQPTPGYHSWTTPAGWTYIQAPYRYPV